MEMEHISCENNAVTLERTSTITKSRAVTTPPSPVRLCNVDIQGPVMNPSLVCHGMRCEELPDKMSFVELYASRISEGSFLSVDNYIVTHPCWSPSYSVRDVHTHLGPRKTNLSTNSYSASSRSSRHGSVNLSSKPIPPISQFEFRVWFNRLPIF